MKPVFTIFDEVFVEDLKHVTVTTGRQMGRSLEQVMKGFDGWGVHIQAWAENFKTNSHVWGAEFIPLEERQRQAARARRKKQNGDCLHGKTKFDISWAVELKCPRCYSRSVYVGKETIKCLLCGWSKRRVNGTD